MNTVAQHRAHRRRHKRVETTGHVFGQVTESEHTANVGLTFQSEIIEISPCGLRLATELALDEGTLDLWVQIDGFPKRMFLSTQIRWSEFVDDGLRQIGVEIVNNPLADLDDWCEFQRQEWFRHKAAS